MNQKDPKSDLDTQLKNISRTEFENTKGDENPTLHKDKTKLSFPLTPTKFLSVFQNSLFAPPICFWSKTPSSSPNPS